MDASYAKSVFGCAPSTHLSLCLAGKNILSLKIPSKNKSRLANTKPP